jgi:methionyl-tRNA formyltransferase
VRIVAAGVSSREVPNGAIRVVEGTVLLGCGNGSLELRLVRPEGKPQMAAMDWMRGRRDADTLEIDHG